MNSADIKKLVRPHIFTLKPYEAARHLMNEPAVLLDANENPFETKYNRYPDPWQRELKESISELKQVDASQLFIGNGSDEIIDLLLRIFCEPGKDKIITTPPTYGMYKVSASINNVENVEVSLNADFSLNAQKVLEAVDNQTKMIFICSPNNPTGNMMKTDTILQILQSFRGMVVIDEAYADFSDSESWIKQVPNYENLVVMQTLSKAFGLAGLRIGLAFASPFILSLLDKIKPPYNISSLNQKAAINALEDANKRKLELIQIKEERMRLEKALYAFPFVERIFPSDANFLLVKMKNADAVFRYLKERGIVVRNRSREVHCEGCLRITVGTKNENDLLLGKLEQYEN